MTTNKSKFRALSISMVSLLVCIVMLVGATFAWFSESESTGVNNIVTGTLDIELSYMNATMGQFREIESGTENLFVNPAGGLVQWNPGVVSVCYFKIENAGSLALKYLLYVNYKDLVTSGNIKLSDALKTAIVEWDGQTRLSREEAIKAATGHADTLGYQNVAVKEMQAGADPRYVAMIVYMPAETGNEFNLNMGQPLKIQLGINLLAGQLNAEFDSFGPDYDKDAPLAPTEPDGTPVDNP